MPELVVTHCRKGGEGSTGKVWNDCLKDILSVKEQGK